MSKLTRRQFLEDSMFAAAAAAAASSAIRLPAAETAARKVGANERLQIATIGVNGQGGGHIDELLNNKDVQYVAICDVDSAAYEKQRKQFDKKGMSAPEYVQDIR